MKKKDEISAAEEADPPITIVEAVKIRLLRLHERDRILFLPGTELSVSIAEANWLIGHGKAVEVMLIKDEVTL